MVTGAIGLGIGGCLAATFYGVYFQRDTISLMTWRLAVYLMVGLLIYGLLQDSLTETAAIAVTIPTAGVAGFFSHR